jgi:hypothetical protein
MAELILIMSLAVILFGTFLMFLFFNSAFVLLNLAIIIALIWRIRTNLAVQNNQKYYVISLLLTSLFFIYSGSGIGKYLLEVAENLLISNITMTVALVYAFAHVVHGIRIAYKNLMKKYNKRRGN